MMDRCEHVTRAHAMSEGRLARRYVAYYRVSTIQRRQFGFSIEARRAAVQDYVSANPGSVVAEFSEVMSGRKDRRPELAKALSMCRITRAVLVIARLDRLSGNVEMIARLIEGRLEFVAVDFPHANRFTIHILAAVAEYESRLSSERMKQVIAARRERRAKVGRFASGLPGRFPPGCQEASALMRQARSEARARMTAATGRCEALASALALEQKSVDSRETKVCEVYRRRFSSRHRGARWCSDTCRSISRAKW
jgi:DNA invertase Pin-like site-specific DNA recombinase